MHMNKGRRAISLAGLVALLTCVALSSTQGDEADSKSTEPQQESSLTLDSELLDVEIMDSEVDVAKPGKHWIGVVFKPLESEVLKSQLNIDHGVIVVQVLDDSPAQEVGLQKNDILLAVDDQPITELKVLVDNITRAEDQELKLIVLRNGKRHKAKITPVERPAKYAQGRTSSRAAFCIV